MESFFLSETCKYLYMIFDETNMFVNETIVFNTEGHIFPLESRFFEKDYTEDDTKPPQLASEQYSSASNKPQQQPLSMLEHHKEIDAIEFNWQCKPQSYLRKISAGAIQIYGAKNLETPWYEDRKLFDSMSKFTTPSIDELSVLTKDQLFKICVDNNITVKKSSNKTSIVNHIINVKEERDRLQKKLVDDNPSNQFHRGHVEYKLPVLIITKILELTWRISTNNNHTPLLPYREALQLTLINKQFYGIISQMFNNVKICLVSSRIEEAQDRLSSVWCPIKHIVKLVVEIPIFERLMKQPSAHLTHNLSAVEKVEIYRETDSKLLSATSIKTFGTIATNLISLSFIRVTMVHSHVNAICSIKSLRKIAIWYSKTPYAALIELCKGLPLLESIKKSNLNVTHIPKLCRSRMKLLSEVCLEDTVENFEFPNLQKLTLGRIFRDSTLNYYKLFSQTNITHLSVYFKSNLISIIILFPCIVTLEDLHYHCQSDGPVMSNQLKSIILPATLSRIIIRTKTKEIFEPNNYLIDMGFQYSKDSSSRKHRRMIFNKIIN
ncbi:hypothetical protein PPL_03407 [Heterostelium album PN500]|uniref:Alpha-1,2-Mannosidase n=1 Tax=Heterostelium pallidum (strain ATCC 26659 / Pp 5 / PN500) TaxID=670386 RepID=D3B4T1_HETP5|nr:hypothetical protein PPL_03407 [Heterostelium album PN500]EFA84329.1 hypothetical protein PPL_03407 [Heterostelium album PN500]|eukprot:XP_020436444.1 hypothetical protein PPL_03407 [Heterostelium album PN500]